MHVVFTQRVLSVLVEDDSIREKNSLEGREKERARGKKEKRYFFQFFIDSKIHQINSISQLFKNNKFR